VVYLLAAMRWWLLTQIQRIQLSIRAAVALTFIGQFFNSFLLGSIGGDVVKLYYIHKYAPQQKTRAAVSLIMDRVLGLLVLVSGSLLAMPWQYRWVFDNERIRAIALTLALVLGLGAAVVIGLALAPFHRSPDLFRRAWSWIPHRIIFERAVSALRQHRVAPAWTLGAVAVAAALTLALVAAAMCIAIALGIEVTYMQMLILLTIAICVISLPISIGGHGVREGIFVILFGAFGVPGAGGQGASSQEQAVVFSLLFFAVPLVWSVVGGFVYIGYSHDYGRVE
jgi:hypothetical protein